MSWAGWGGGGGGDVRQTIWVRSCSQPSSTYANGKSYSPLLTGGDDYIDFEFPVLSANPKLRVEYAMSGASSNDVRWRLDWAVLSSGGAQTTSLTTGTYADVAPGNDTNRHVLSESDVADFAISAAAGTTVVARLTRLGTGESPAHTGDARVGEMWVV